MSDKTRYTDEELEEFKVLILEKLEKARKEYDLLRADVMNSDGNDTADTSPTFKVLEEGARLSEKRRQADSPSVRPNSSPTCKTRLCVSRTRHMESTAKPAN